MSEEERRRMWDNYPDVPNGMSEVKREIKDIRDVSVECPHISWNDCPPIKECADMGDVNGNKLDMGIVELEDRVIVTEQNENNA